MEHTAQPLPDSEWVHRGLGGCFVYLLRILITIRPCSHISTTDRGKPHFCYEFLLTTPLFNSGQFVVAQQMQKTQNGGSADSQGIQKNGFFMEVLDVLVFFGIAMNTYNLWAFPTGTIVYGGVYFIAVSVIMHFLFILPLLHLEIFVGQLHQAGMCKIYRSYGTAFEGVGAVLFFLTLIFSVQGVVESYLSVNHIKTVFSDFADIVSCSSERYAADCQELHGCSCISIFDHYSANDTEGAAKKSDTDIVSGTNAPLIVGIVGSPAHGALSPRQTLLRNTSMAELYARSLKPSPFSIVAMPQCVYFAAVFAICLCVTTMTGVMVAKVLIAVVYVAFFAFHVVSSLGNIAGAGQEGLVKALWHISNPEALISIQVMTYLVALSMALKSCGVATWGVLSAAALRRKGSGHSYEIAIAMVVNNIVISTLSLLSTLGIISYMVDNKLNLYEYSPRLSTHAFFLGLTTDLFAARDNDHLWLFIYNMPHVLTQISSLFPVILMLHATGNDEISGLPKSNASIRSISTYLGGFYITALMCFTPLSGYVVTIFSSIQFAYEFVVVAAMVVIFVHWYGPHEHLVDICEHYPEDAAEIISLRPSNPIFFAIYDMIPFICIGFAAIGTLHAVSTTISTKGSLFVFFVGIAIPPAIFLMWFFSNLCRNPQSMETSYFVSVTPEHPAYRRIRLAGPSAPDPISYEVYPCMQRQVDAKQGAGAKLIALTDTSILRAKVEEQQEKTAILAVASPTPVQQSLPQTPAALSAPQTPVLQPTPETPTQQSLSQKGSGWSSSQKRALQDTPLTPVMSTPPTPVQLSTPQTPAQQSVSRTEKGSNGAVVEAEARSGRRGSVE